MKKKTVRRKATNKTAKTTKRYPNVEAEFKFVPYLVAGVIALLGVQMMVKAGKNRGPASDAQIRAAEPNTNMSDTFRPHGKFND